MRLIYSAEGDGLKQRKNRHFLIPVLEVTRLNGKYRRGVKFYASLDNETNFDYTVRKLGGNIFTAPFSIGSFVPNVSYVPARLPVFVNYAL
ncbi:MAG: hypothetical protein FWF80_01330, partial [Defluviitaleaceae bacterium]|nr:hypothetical protein [Defluviitaleaceae bacterium]